MSDAISSATRLLLGILGLFFLAANVANALPRDPCALPQGLDAKLAAKFPSAHVIRLSDLNEGDKKLYRKSHGYRCPGFAEVDFYGDKKPTWAIVLLSGEAPLNLKAELLVARKLEADWDIRSLEVTDGTPVVWREPPGKYEGLYKEYKPVRARNPVIVFCGYSSWAIVYAWTGKKVEKVWLSD